MKAILEFNLPEDLSDFELANRACKVEVALWEFSGILRQYWKGNHDFKTADEAIEKIRDDPYNCFNEINTEGLLQ